MPRPGRPTDQEHLEWVKTCLITFIPAITQSDIRRVGQIGHSRKVFRYTKESYREYIERILETYND